MIPFPVLLQLVLAGVAGIDDLIASKEALQRPKDQAVLVELRELRDNGG